MHITDIALVVSSSSSSFSITTSSGTVVFLVTAWWLFVWFLQGMYMNEFMGLTFDTYVLDGEQIGQPIPGWYVIREMYGMKTKRGKWQDLAVLFGMIVAYRLIFFVCIKLSENLGPFVRSKLTQYRTNKKLSRKHSELQHVIRPVASPLATPQHDAVPLQFSKHRCAHA
jgi:hypothetical protein